MRFQQRYIIFREELIMNGDRTREKIKSLMRFQQRYITLREEWGEINETIWKLLRIELKKFLMKK